MKTPLSHQILHIPLSIWLLQFLYVAVALAILYAFISNHQRTTGEIILFVVVMIIVNVAWRLAIR